MAGLAGVSTLGVTFGVGYETVAGEKPSSFEQLTRINQIAGISIENETIDASALEDLIERTVAGRGSTGGSWAITVNATEETIAEWTDVIAKYNAGLADGAGKRTWFEVIVPTFSKAFFVVAQPPQQLPLPEVGQNELLTMEIGLTIEEYKGMDTKVALTA